MEDHLTNHPTAPIKAFAVPFDPALPGVALLQQPARLLDLLSHLLADWLGADAQLLDSRVVIKHFRPGKRCSAELELVLGPARAAPGERRRVLGKVYSEDQGARVYETLRELRCHGFSAGRFIVPEPLAYDSDQHLLLLRWAEGELLSTRLLTSYDLCQGIEDAAAWLLAFHRCGLTSGRLYTLSRHLYTLSVWKQQMTEVFPAGERLLADLFGRIEERGRALSGWTPGPTHRDFSPEHLVTTGAQLVGLDFDEFCQYDPLFDVAHFAAHLRFLGLTHSGSLDHFDWLADRFLGSYKAGGGDYSEQRLSLYEAIAYFKLARSVALVWRPQGWMQALPPLLSEALRLL